MDGRYKYLANVFLDCLGLGEEKGSTSRKPVQGPAFGLTMILDAYRCGGALAHKAGKTMTRTK